jgi:hypothetical protein
MSAGFFQVTADCLRKIWGMGCIDSKKSWQLECRVRRTRLSRFIKMYPDGQTSSGGEDPDQVDPWIQAQLSTDQIRWLNNQGSAVNRGDLLKSALAEWVVRHPEDWFRGTRLVDALRSALTEFIGRHKDEFQ